MENYLIPTVELWRKMSVSKDQLIGKLVLGRYGRDWTMSPDRQVHVRPVYGRITDVHTSVNFTEDLMCSRDGMYTTIDGLVLDNGDYISFGYGHIIENLRIEI